MERQYYSERKAQRRLSGRRSEELKRLEEEENNSWRHYLGCQRDRKYSQEADLAPQAQNAPINVRAEDFPQITRERLAVILVVVSLIFFSLFALSRDYSQEQCYQMYKQLKCQFHNLTDQCQKYFTCFQEESRDYTDLLDKISKAILGCIMALIVKACHRYIPYLRMIMYFN